MENKKQEIISLLDEMDESTLDWLLYVIKLRPKKSDRISFNVDSDAKEIWDKVSQVIKKELTEVSYNTWIAKITPVEIEENIFRLAVESEFHKGITKERYSELIKSGLMYVTGIEYELEIFVGDAAE